MSTKLQKRPRAFIDVETTGLDPNIHELIDFAACFEDGTEVHFKVRPCRIDSADPKALAINGYAEKDWIGALDPQEAAKRIASLLKEHTLVGHNVNFDVSFLRALLQRTQTEVTLGYHLIDTITLAYEHLVPRGLESLSLKNVCLFLALPPEPEKHEAINGAACCMAIYKEMLKGSAWERLAQVSG